MIVCPECGRQSNDTAKFCDKCGKPLPKSAAHVYDAAYVPPVKVTAEQHFKAQAAQAKRAKKQEAAQQEAYKAAYEQAEPRPEDMQLALRPQKTYKGPLIVTIVIALVLVIGLGIALAVQSYRLYQMTNWNESTQKSSTVERGNGFSYPDAEDNSKSYDSDKDFNKDYSKDGSGTSKELSTPSSYKDIVSNLIDTIKSDAGSFAATAIRESNGTLADVDNDGEEELMLIYSVDGKTITASVYCADGTGEITSVTEELGAVDDTEFAGIYSGVLGNSAIVCLVSTSKDEADTFICNGTMYTLKDGAIRKLHTIACSEPSDGAAGGVYMLDGKKITKSKFNDYLGALETRECFYGTDTPGYSLLNLKNLLK
ncbi:MAG: zinc-ribbon domain-containing protein [Eggerthellaceae bacterium]|nr:zinc-ribbon domain-containing protein [Eggerthellaceae bacterium]